MGRWGPASGMPVRYDQSRCCAELASKQEMWSKLQDGFKPGNDFELPTCDAEALQMSAKAAYAQSMSKLDQADAEQVGASSCAGGMLVLINHRTGGLHKHPPCGNVRDSNLDHYEGCTEDLSNLHSTKNAPRVFSPTVASKYNGGLHLIPTAIQR